MGKMAQLSAGFQETFMDIEKAKKEALDEISGTAKALRITFLTVDEKLKAIDQLVPILSDIDDRLTTLESVVSGLASSEWADRIVVGGKHGKGRSDSSSETSGHESS